MLEGMSGVVEVNWAENGGKNIPGKSMSRCPSAEGNMVRRRNSKLSQCGWCGKSKENCMKMRFEGPAEARLHRVSCKTC